MKCNLCLSSENVILLEADDVNNTFVRLNV